MQHARLNGALRQLGKLTQIEQTDGQTDACLLERFISERDGAAFETLVRRHGPIVLGVCLRVLRNRHDAEDAFQAVFLVLVRKARSILHREVLAGWLHGVARHTAWRARSLLARRHFHERQVRAMSADASQPIEREAGCLTQELDAALARLPRKYRDLLVLCDLEGATRQQAARQLGLPAGTVSSRLARARQLLRKRLERCATAPAAGLPVLASSEALATLPPALIRTTVQASLSLASGECAAGAISAPVFALMEGVLNAMWMSKLRVLLVTVTLLGLLSVGVGGLAGRMSAAASAEVAKAPAPDEVQPPAVPAPPAQPLPVPAPPPPAQPLPDPVPPKAQAVPVGEPQAPAPAPKAERLLAELNQDDDRLHQLVRVLLAKKRSDEQIFEALYLATLSRLPNEVELKRLGDFAAAHDQDQRERAFQQIARVLTLTNEFRTNLQAMQQYNARGQSRTPAVSAPQVIEYPAAPAAQPLAPPPTINRGP